MDKKKQEVTRVGCPKASDPKVHRYNFKFTEEQTSALCRCYEEPDARNRSRFIVKRTFAEEFRVVKTDPSMAFTWVFRSRPEASDAT